jgi:hypothetical protein
MSAALLAAGILGPASFVNSERDDWVALVAFGLLAISTAVTAWGANRLSSDDKAAVPQWVFGANRATIVASFLFTYVGCYFSPDPNDPAPADPLKLPPLGIGATYALLCLASA